MIWQKGKEHIKNVCPNRDENRLLNLAGYYDLCEILI